MRNLKRALSLVLASIMLLGMMVTGAGAVESTGFTDSDQIVNQEAAAVTSGLGIFDGYTDGSFGPEKVVTRAEMAVIICKILNGADVDPGNFTGVSMFTDVPSWAEGYVNYCASMEIVKGVGDGKFDPNSPVTTVQAATMLLKALGYFTDEDQLKEDWKTVVTGRATTLGLYGALTLAVDEGLTRDNVAELVFHTIQAQRVAYDDNRHLYVNNRNRDEVVTNGTKDWRNTLAENTFDMWIVDGVVTANSYTSDALSETVNNAPRTNVQFYDANTIEGYVEDYPATTYTGQAQSGGYPFEYTTGLDMIGHAARVYYKIERNAPYVYAITDRATKVEYISYNSNSTLRANAANEAGFRRNTINDISTNDYKVNYDWTNTVGELAKTANTSNDRHVELAGPSVNKTLLLISNSSDYKVDVVIVLDQYLDTVRRVVEASDTNPVDYKLTTRDGSDQNVPHGDFAVSDYVVVTDIGNRGEMLNIEAPEKVTASISKITGVSDGNGTVKSITADGTEYSGSPVAHHETAKQTLTNARTLDNTTNFEDIQTIGETTLLLDFQGKCIGLAEEEAMINYAYAAQFGVAHTGGSLNTEYDLTVKLYFIDGTNGVYTVNTSSGTSTTNTFKNLKMSIHGNELYARAVAKLLNDGFVLGVAGSDYPYENEVGTTRNTATYDPKDTYAANIGVDANGELTGITSDTTTGLGIYRVSLRSDNTVVLRALSVDQASQANVSGVRMIPGHSTLVQANGRNVVQDAARNNRDMYQTNKTAYFYVDGSYEGNLSVGVKYGVNNMVNITVGSDKDTNGRPESIEQLFVDRIANPKATDRDTISAIMVYGYDMGSDDTLYFYKEGNYHINTRDGGTTSRAGSNTLVSVTYDMYQADGTLYQKTYDNGGKYYDIEVARDMVDDHSTGFYTLGSDDIDEEYVVTRRGGDSQNNNDLVTSEYNVLLTDSAKYRTDKKANELEGAHNVYILNATAYHDAYQDNNYTAIDAVGGITGGIIDEALVVDTTGNGIDTMRTIADKCLAGDLVRVSYTYKTTGEDSYKVKVIYVTDFKPGQGSSSSSGSTLGTPTLWAKTDANYMVVRVYDEYNKATVIELRDSIAGAYRDAGYTVTDPVFLGANDWGLTISGNGLTTAVNVTNKSGGGYNTNGYYIPVTVLPVAKVMNGKNLVGYYDEDAPVEINYTADVDTVLYTVGNDPATQKNVTAGKWTYTIKPGDVNKPIVVNPAVKVNITTANALDAVYYYVDNDSTQNVTNGGTVPYGVTLFIEPKDAKSLITVVQDGKTVDNAEAEPDAKYMTYEVKSYKTITVTFGAAANTKMLVAGPYVKLTYGQDSVGNRAVTETKILDGGTTGNSVKLTGDNWKVTKAEIVGGVNANGAVITTKSATELTDNDKLVGSTDPTAWNSSSDEVEVSDDGIFYAMFPVTIGRAMTISIGDETPIEAGGADQKKVWATPGAELKVTGLPLAGSSFNATGANVNTTAAANNRDSVEGTLVIGAQPVVVENTVAGGSSAAYAVTMASLSLTAEQFKAFMLKMGLKENEANYATEYAIVPIYTRPDANHLDLRVRDSAGNIVFHQCMVYVPGSKPANAPAEWLFCTDKTNGDYGHFQTYSALNNQTKEGCCTNDVKYPSAETEGEFVEGTASNYPGLYPEGDYTWTIYCNEIQTATGSFSVSATGHPIVK